MALAPREVQLWVRGRNIPVARSLLQFRSTPPREWTVARTNHGSDPYLVCPSCRHRASLPDGQASSLRCPRCNELFTIAWDEDRKSTRLNSSHSQISYAVFCLQNTITMV